MIFKEFLTNYLKNNDKKTALYADDYLKLDMKYTDIVTNITLALNDIVKHRKGKIIRPSDIYLLNNIHLNKLNLYKKKK